MKNKELEKSLDNLREVCKKNKETVTLVLAVSDGEKINTTFMGSIADAANLLANFKDNDNDFKRADSLSNIMIKGREMMMRSGLGDEIESFMDGESKRMEKKERPKADC